MLVNFRRKYAKKKNYGVHKKSYNVSNKDNIDFYRFVVCRDKDMFSSESIITNKPAPGKP